MWANSVWGLLTLAVGFWLAMIGLSPEWIWLRPWFLWGGAFCMVASTTVLFLPLRVGENRAIVLANIKHPAKWLSKVIEPSLIIALGLLIAAAGVFWNSRKAATAAEPIVIHAPPSAEDIAKAAAPIEQKLKLAIQQRDDALSENATLRNQIQNLPRGANRPLPPPNPVEYRRLSRDQMNILVDEFSNALDEFPIIYLAKADDVRGEANQYMRDFSEAFERAGIKTMNVSQKPKPRQTGVFISIADPEKPSPSALRTQSILSDAGIVAPFASLPTELSSLPSGFTIFIAPNPL